MKPTPEKLALLTQQAANAANRQEIAKLFDGLGSFTEGQAKLSESSPELARIATFINDQYRQQAESYAQESKRLRELGIVRKPE